MQRYDITLSKVKVTQTYDKCVSQNKSSDMVANCLQTSNLHSMYVGCVGAMPSNYQMIGAQNFTSMTHSNGHVIHPIFIHFSS